MFLFLALCIALFLSTLTLGSLLYITWDFALTSHARLLKLKRRLNRASGHVSLSVRGLDSEDFYELQEFLTKRRIVWSQESYLQEIQLASFQFFIKRDYIHVHIPKESSGQILPFKKSQ